MKLKKYKDFITESVVRPWIHEGYFQINKNMLDNGRVIKDKIPDEINGDFTAWACELTTLEGFPKIIRGNFDVESNKLTSLEYGPEIVDGAYNCSKNFLTSLKGCVKECIDTFNCNDNQLTSLEYGPTSIGEDFLGYNNNFKTFFGAPFEIKGVFSIDSDDLIIEHTFIRSGDYKNNYWSDLLMHMTKEKIDFNEITTWPKGFLTDNIKNSVKSISKFNI